MEALYPTTTPVGSAPNALPAGADASYWDQWKGYNQLSRFKWDAEASALDMSTQQDIIRVEVQRGQCCHVAGDVAFDNDGNLLLATGALAIVVWPAEAVWHVPAGELLAAATVVVGAICVWQLLVALSAGSLRSHPR